MNEYVVISKLTWTPEVLVGVACFVLCCRSVSNAAWVCRRPRDVKYCWEDNERSGVMTENYEIDLISNTASLGPRPKTNLSVDHFQYRALYWKRYTRRMRSGDKTTIQLDYHPFQSLVFQVNFFTSVLLFLLHFKFSLLLH